MECELTHVTAERSCPESAAARPLRSEVTMASGNQELCAYTCRVPAC